MSEKKYRLNITSEQSDLLFQIQSKLMKEVGFGNGKDSWVGQSIALYISVIATDAERENAGITMDKIHRQRRNYIESISKYFGNYPTGEDIISFIEKYVDVDSFIKEIIIKDVRQLK